MDRSQGSKTHIATIVLLFLGRQPLYADTFTWKNPRVSGAFNSPLSWVNAGGNGGIPGVRDTAIFGDGTYTVTCNGAVAGKTMLNGAVTFELDGAYSTGSALQGGNSFVLRGGGTLTTDFFSSLGDGDIVVDGSGLSIETFDFRTSSLRTKIRGMNGARIKSSAQLYLNSLVPEPRLESGSEWRHGGTLSVNTLFVSGGALLVADQLTGRVELDGGRLNVRVLKGGGHAGNGSTVIASAATLGDWLLEGSGSDIHVTDTTFAGPTPAEIRITLGATFSAGALDDNTSYSVDGSGSRLVVAGRINSRGIRQFTLQNGGLGSCGSLRSDSVLVRDFGSVFSIATNADISTVRVEKGGRIQSGSLNSWHVSGNPVGCLVTGNGSALVLSGDLNWVQSKDGAVTVREGGRLECAKAVLDGYFADGTFSSSVVGAGSLLLAREGMTVGKEEGLATLNLGDGGRVEVGGAKTTMTLGLRPGSFGIVEVDGRNTASPTILDTRLAAEMGVGVEGKASLDVWDRARVLASKLTVGVQKESDGWVVISGPDARLDVDGALEVGRAGAAQLQIFSSATATASFVSIGSTTRTNLLRVTDEGSKLTVSNSLRVGTHGSGHLRLTQGGQVLLTGTYVDPDLTGTGLFSVGANEGATGYVSVDGTGSSLVGPSSRLDLGPNGNSFLAVNNGGLVQFASIRVLAGREINGMVSITGIGSVVRAMELFEIGSDFPKLTSEQVVVGPGSLLESTSTLAVGKTGTLIFNLGSAVVGQTDEAPISDTLLVAKLGKFYLGGRLNGSVLVRPGGIFKLGIVPGKVRIEGNLALAPGASFELKVGGDLTGTLYDQLEVARTVTLAGHLDLVFRDGFAPTNGQVFELVKAGSITGSFSEVTVKGLASGFTYVLDHADGKVLRLTATTGGVANSAPNLQITRLGATQVVVSWPGFVSGWTLQQSIGFPANSWQTIAAPGNSVTLPAPAGSSLFRLVSP